MTSKNRRALPALAIFLAVLAVSTLTFCSANAQPDKGSTTGSSNGKDSTLKAAVIKLQRGKEVDERLQAIITIASHAEAVGTSTRAQLTESLHADSDPLVRGAVAFTLGQVAAKQAKGIEPGPDEEKILAELSTALSREKDASVRRAIARAAAGFNHSNAEKLIDAALADPNREVQQAARNAKMLREQRRIKLTTG